MRCIRVHALCALLSFAVIAPVAAQIPVTPLETAATPDVSVAANETPEIWFVELASPPSADGTKPSTLAAERAAFRSQAQKAGLKYTERYAYESLFNGFSVKIARSDIGKLSRISGVQRIYPVGTVQLHDATIDTPDQQDWLSMTGADTAQNVLGVHGDGIRVAVMDTGVDYLHPDLGGCFGPGCRVEMGYDLVGDAYDAVTSPTPVPDPDPMDCNGHGTHVSGIVGADGHGLAGHVTGVAPHVKFHAYRVFGCNGSTSDDIMLKAMEMILADGADVLNMSIGSAFEDWSESPTAAGSDRLVRKGIVVVASAGNSGANGTYSTGAPSTGKKVISVASFENLSVKLPLFTITPDDHAIGYFAAVGAPPPPTSGILPVEATSTLLGCNPGQAVGSLTGKAALVKRGTCSFYEKAFNAQKAGASAVILYNNAAGFVSPTVAGTPPITIPVVSITLADGNLIASRLSTGPVTMTWTNQLLNSPNPSAGLVSTFSSFGPSAELDFKPDLGAPGGNIYSTYFDPVTHDGYATLSGTSMASPHVAGSVALLLQAKPHTPPPLARDLLQNNAVPANWNGNPGLGFLDNVHVQGAGLIHIDRTITTNASISPAKLALGEGQAGPVTQTLTLQNGGGAAVTYDLTHVGALTTGPSEFTVSEFVAPASVAFSAPSVTVPAGGTATVNATITAPTTANLYTYGGYLVATPQAGGLPLRVPYIGVTGDYQAVKVLGTAGAGLPLLARLVSGSFSPVGDGAVFTMADGDHIPYILVQLAHAARTLKAEIFSAPASAGGPLGQSWHSAFQAEYLGRNSAATSFFSVGLDGQTANGHFVYTLPNGSYVAVMSALKPLGNSANPADWETWQSPVFTIARP
jgi:subtilisin family serine protease